MSIQAFSAKDIERIFKPSIQEDVSEDAELDFIQATFLQVAFVLVIVFALACIHFRTYVQARAEEQIAKARAEAGVAAARYNAIAESDQGQAYLERETALIDLQMQKLLRALDEIEQGELHKLALDLFLADQAGEWSIALADIIKDGALAKDAAGQRFASGSRHAQQCMAGSNLLAAWRQEWLKAALAASGVSMRADNRPIADAPEQINEVNQKALTDEINRRTAALRDQMRRLHAQARVLLLQYYQEHPEAIQDESLQSLMESFRQKLKQAALIQQESGRITTDLASETDLSALVNSMGSAMDRYVSEVFRSEKAPLLDE